MEIVVTFAATHHAILGEKALVEAGLPVNVMPLPLSLGAGCGLCLRIPGTEWPRARQRLAKAGISPRGCYEKRGEAGRTVYTPLSDPDVP